MDYIADWLVDCEEREIKPLASLQSHFDRARIKYYSGQGCAASVF